MARNPSNPDAAAKLKALKIATPAKVAAMPSKLGVQQASSPLSTAQKARLASIRAQARAFSGR